MNDEIHRIMTDVKKYLHQYLIEYENERERDTKSTIITVMRERGNLETSVRNFATLKQHANNASHSYDN